MPEQTDEERIKYAKEARDRIARTIDALIPAWGDQLDPRHGRARQLLPHMVRMLEVFNRELDEYGIGSDGTLGA